MIPDYVIQAALDAQSGQHDPYGEETQIVGYKFAPPAPVPAPPPAPIGPPPPPPQGLDPGMQAAVQAAFAQQAAPTLGPPPAIPSNVVAAAQEAAAPPPAPPQTGPSPMSSVLESAIRGSQQVVPGGFRKTGYQLAQEGPAPMPGTDIPQTGPTIATGVADIDAATFRALSPDAQREYLGRLTSQTTKPLRVGPEPIDMDLFDALTPEQQKEYQRRIDSQTSTISTGPKALAPTGEPVRPESPYGRALSDLANAEDRALLGEQQTYDDRVANMELLARKYSADEAQANARVYELEDEQRRRSEYIATELPKLESYLEKRAQVQAMNPVDEYNKSRGFGGRLMNAIALGLSTLGSGLTGAPNIVWEMIQKQIDGEVLKQRQTTETLGQQYMARRQLYADMLGQFRTPELAEQATRYSLETAAAAAARRLAARAQGDDAVNASNALVDQAEAKRAATKKALLEGTQRTLWQDVPGRVVGQQGGIVGLVKQLKLMGVPEKDLAPIVSTIVNKGTQAGAEMIGLPDSTPSRDEMRKIQYEGETSVPVPDRFAGFLGSKNLRAVDHSDAVKKREVLAEGDRLLESYDRLGKLVATGSVLSPTQRAEVEQISATAMGSWRVMLGLGVLSESDKDLLVPVSGIFVNDIMSLRDKKKMIENLRSLVFRTVKTVGQTASKGEGTFNPAVKPIVSRDVK